MAKPLGNGYPMAAVIGTPAGVDGRTVRGGGDLAGCRRT